MAISNASNQIVKVNLIPGIIPSVLHLSQYDTGAGRPITFSVYDGSQAFTIPSGVSIAFEGTKPDGNGFSFTCSKSGSSALLTNYTNQMTALPGKIMCQLVFTDTSGGRVGSLPVLMVVTPAGINGDTVISDSDIEAIVAAQNQYAVLNARLDAAIDQMNTTTNKAVDQMNTMTNKAIDQMNTKANDLQNQYLAEKAEREATDTTINARIDQIIAPSGEAPSAAEVTDARIAADGTVFGSAGTAIRSQVDDLKGSVDAMDKYWYANQVAETGNGFVSMAGVITANSNYKYAKYVLKKSSEKIRVTANHVYGTSSNYAVFAFFNANNELIKAISNSVINPTSTGKWVSYYEQDIPMNSSYVLITFANMASSTSFDNIDEYGFYKPSEHKMAFNQGPDRSYIQQFYFHLPTSALGDYDSLALNVKLSTAQPVLDYGILFVGYDEDYSNRQIAFYKNGRTTGIDGNKIEIHANFQDTSVSLRDKHFVGAVVNLKYAKPSLDTGAYLRFMNQYGVISEYCTINDIPVTLVQYPSGSFPYTSREYHEPFNPMYGGFLCAIGDSLTAVYYKSEAESWVSLIAQWNNMRYENHGISGNPMAKSDSYTGGKCMAERVDDLDRNKCYTHIFVMGGANDYNLQIPIGENTDTDITTFKGAVNHIIKRLTDDFPMAKIVFATTYRRNEAYRDKPYADAMLEVCKLHSIPCLNNYEDSGVQFFNKRWMTWFGATNALGNNHLNAAGDLFVAPRFEHALKHGVC